MPPYLSALLSRSASAGSSARRWRWPRPGSLLMLGLGVFAYDLDVDDAAKVPAAVVTFLVGALAFAAMGMAVAGLRPLGVGRIGGRQRDHPADGVHLEHFIPIEASTPSWLDTLGDVLPLKPFAQSFQDCFNPAVDPPAFNWAKLAVVAVLGVAGLLVALRWFRWEPARGGSTRRRRTRVAVVDPATSGGDDVHPELNEEHEAVRGVVRDFVVAEIEPHAEEWDRDHTFPVDTVLKMGELGLFGVPFPAPYGGGGDLTGLCVAIEEIARADQSLAITLEAGVGSRRQSDPQVRHAGTAGGLAPRSLRRTRVAGSVSPCPTPAATPAARGRGRVTTKRRGSG